MKKYIIGILLIILMPFVVNAKVCDTNRITIESITLENKSDKVEELSGALIEGKNIKIDLSMFDVGDYAKYKFF